MKYIILLLLISTTLVLASCNGGPLVTGPKSAEVPADSIQVASINVPVDFCGVIRDHTFRTEVVLDPHQTIEVSAAFLASKHNGRLIEEPLDEFSYELVDAGNPVFPMAGTDSTRTWKRLYVTISHKISCDLLDKHINLLYQITSTVSDTTDTEKDWGWPR